MAKDILKNILRKKLAWGCAAIAPGNGLGVSDIGAVESNLFGSR